MNLRISIAILHVLAILVGLTVALHTQSTALAGTENIRFMGATFLRNAPYGPTDQFFCFGKLGWHSGSKAADVFADLGPGDAGDSCYGGSSQAAWFDVRGRSLSTSWGSYYMWAHHYDGGSISTSCNDAKSEIWWWNGSTWVLLGYEHYLHVNAAAYLPQPGDWVDHQIWIGDGVWINSWYQIGVTSNDASVCSWEGYHVHQTYVKSAGYVSVNNGPLTADSDGTEYDQDAVSKYIHQWTGW